MLKRSRFYYLILFFLIFALGYATYLIIRPFISPIAWAIVFSIVFYPFYAFLNKYLRWRSLSSFLTVIIILLMILGPIAYFSYSVAREIDEILKAIKGERMEFVDKIVADPRFQKGIEKAMEKLSIDRERFTEILIHTLSDAVKSLLKKLRVTVESIPSFFMDFLLMLISIYFFLKDGPYFIERVSNYLPFAPEQKSILFRQIRDIIVTTIYGGVVVALLQSLAGGFIFHLLDVPRASLLGFAIFFASFVPIVGTFGVWGPTVFFLLYQGLLAKAIILFAFGFGVISMIDNVVRPLIVREKVKMPLILVFFSILGGISLFGLLGIIMGPLIVALFVSVLEIFRFTEEK
ncbi:MAG: AI-2E family transporter [Desulfobacterota bacterium]|nr:AI-2E family transporter [Thermodesulfobacteriota bacterium]MDW8001715.1 AI-2E family transporter [Deltaproteobacteria bacterium]